jgi:hypothetical protein
MSSDRVPGSSGAVAGARIRSNGFVFTSQFHRNCVDARVCRGR